MRVLEFGNIKWTDSADHADKLTEGLLNNYGYPILCFANYLMTRGIESIESVWSKWCIQCFDNMTLKDNFSQRIANKLALVMATAEFAIDCFKLNFNLQTILEFMLKMEYDNIEARDIGATAYEYIIEQVS